MSENNDWSAVSEASEHVGEREVAIEEAAERAKLLVNNQ